MFCESLRKAPDITKGGIVNLRAPLTIPIGNHVHIKVLFAAICILAIIVFGVFIGAFGSSKIIVYADSVKGL